MNDDELDTELERIGADRTVLERQRASLQPPVPDDHVDVDLLADLHAKLDAGLDDETRNELVRLLVSDIVVTTTVNTDGTKDVHAAINYRLQCSPEGRPPHRSPTFTRGAACPGSCLWDDLGPGSVPGPALLFQAGVRRLDSLQETLPMNGDERQYLTDEYTVSEIPTIPSGTYDATLDGVASEDHVLYGHRWVWHMIIPEMHPDGGDFDLQVWTPPRISSTGMARDMAKALGADVSKGAKGRSWRPTWPPRPAHRHTRRGEGSQPRRWRHASPGGQARRAVVRSRPRLPGLQGRTGGQEGRRRRRERRGAPDTVGSVFRRSGLTHGPARYLPGRRHLMAAGRWAGSICSAARPTMTGSRASRSESSTTAGCWCAAMPAARPRTSSLRSTSEFADLYPERA